MNICFVKKIVLFVSPLLFAISLAGIYTRQTPYTAQTQDESFLKQAWGGWSGPCITVDDECGDWGGGMGTCALDSDGNCSGVCPAYCPAGGAVKICQSTSGSCNHQMLTCSTMKKYQCLPYGYNMCQCSYIGLGPNCSRQYC